MPLWLLHSMNSYKMVPLNLASTKPTCLSFSFPPWFQTRSQWRLHQKAVSSRICFVNFHVLHQNTSKFADKTHDTSTTTYKRPPRHYFKLYTSSNSWRTTLTNVTNNSFLMPAPWHTGDRHMCSTKHPFSNSILTNSTQNTYQFMLQI